MKGGAATGPSPVDRGKTGSKHHVIVEAHGIPLATILTGGNRNDVTQLLPLIEAVPPATAPVRRPPDLMDTGSLIPLRTRSTRTTPPCSTRAVMPA